MTDKEYKVKEYLMKAQDIHKVISDYGLALEAARARMMSSSSIVKFTKNKHERHNTQQDKVIKYCDYVMYIEKKVNECYEKLKEIQMVIDAVEDLKLRTVLLKRYINNMTWEEIAEELSYDKRWLTELHLRALKAIVKLKIITP